MFTGGVSARRREADVLAVGDHSLRAGKGGKPAASLFAFVSREPEIERSATTGVAFRPKLIGTALATATRLSRTNET